MSNTGLVGALGALESSFELLCHSLERAMPYMASEISNAREIGNSMRESTRSLVVSQMLSGQGARACVIRELGSSGLLTIPASEIGLWIEDRLPRVLCDNLKEVGKELDDIACQLRILSLDNCNATMRWTPRNARDIGGLFVDRTLEAVRGRELTYTQGIYRGRIDAMTRGRQDSEGHTLVLRLMDSNHTLLLFDDHGSTRFYTYVPVEDSWLEHQDRRYVAPGTIRKAFQDLIAQHEWVVDTKESLADICLAIHNTLIDFGLSTNEADLPMPKGYDFRHYERFDPWVFSYTLRRDPYREVTRRVYRLGLGSNVLSITDQGEGQYEFDAFAQVLKTRDWMSLPVRVRLAIKEAFITAIKSTARELDLVKEPQ